MSNSKTLKLITGIGETILAIPVLGGLIVVSFSWTPLLIMFVLHIITLVVSASERTSRFPSLVGIVTSAVGWVPIVGWIMHLISAALLLLSASRRSN